MLDKGRISYSLQHEKRSWWSILYCCGCCGCCSCCVPKVYDYNKKYDIEIESLLPENKDYIQPKTKLVSNQLTSKTIHDKITINVVDDRKDTPKMEFYNDWTLKYWLKVDKIIDYEQHFKISAYYPNDRKSIHSRMDLYALMHQCFDKLPQNINEQIYCLLSSNTLIDDMYRIYYQSLHKIKSKVDNPNDLGCIVNGDQIHKQYKLYLSAKNRQNSQLQQHPKLPNFWKYIGLNSVSAVYGVALIIENNTKHEIFVTWIGYNGKEQSHGNIYPTDKITIGTHTTNTFIIRAPLKSLDDDYDHHYPLFNDLSIIAVYQIRHTYPTHILTVSSLTNPVKLSVGSPLRSIPVITKKYNKCIVENFNIYYQENVFNKYPKLLNILTQDLSQMNRIINDDILNIMHSVAIWINISQDIGHPDGRIKGYGLSFHHDPKWMIKNGIMIEKCRNIEIYSASDYMEWRICQPLVLFHEFVHSFHCFIGRERRDIKKAYNLAMKNHLYDEVEHIVRKDKITKQEIIMHVRGYAAMNHYEYFAQMSEAYFGKCNYYPFNKKQLKQYDTNAYQLCEKIWSFNTKQIQNQHLEYYEE